MQVVEISEEELLVKFIQTMFICCGAPKINTGCIRIFLGNFNSVKIAEEELMITDIEGGIGILKLFFKQNWMHRLSLNHHHHHHHHHSLHHSHLHYLLLLIH